MKRPRNTRRANSFLSGKLVTIIPVQSSKLVKIMKTDCHPACGNTDLQQDVQSASMAWVTMYRPA
jgi:hypothetical protein